MYFDKRVAIVVMKNKESNTFKRKKKKGDYEESGGSGLDNSDNIYQIFEYVFILYHGICILDVWYQHNYYYQFYHRNVWQ